MEETMTAAYAPMMPADRKAAGKRLRDRVPRDAHAGWRAHAGRADSIGILHAADANRQPDLVPLRYGRMLQSPFTFYRGSAGVMAADLAETPTTGIHVQVCGDAHLMNFGVFATPERRVIFDINDLDETLPAPGGGTSNGSSPPLCSLPVPTGSATRTAATRRRHAPVAIAGKCATLPRWTCSTSGMPGSMTATSWRCCRSLRKLCCANALPRRRRPAVRSWCSPSWSSRLAGSPGSTTPLRLFFTPMRRAPPAIWT